MFYKLALRNVRHSLKNYLLYFMTLTLGVCIFYVFNSIEAQQAMIKISESTRTMMKTLTQLIGIISIFVSIILGILIVGANNFLIRRRKKELGTYMILGMEKQKVARILIIETLIIGVFSLVIGLLVGLFISQWLSLFTARLFEADMNQYTFIISWPAIYQTVFYFSIIFIIVMLLSTFSISRYKLVDLINAGRKNEKPRVRNPLLTVVLFLLSVACLGWAYSQVLKNGIIYFDYRLRNEIIIGSIGTFLFFASLSGFFLKLIQSSKSLYYKGLNMFILRQINSRINTAHISMSFICLMLFCTIGILSTGLGMNKAMENSYQMTSPNDVTLKIGGDLSPVEYLAENNFNLSPYLSESVEYREYRLEGLTANKILAGLKDEDGNPVNEDMLKMPLPLIRLSDYNALMSMHNKPQIALDDNQAAVYSDMAPNVEYLHDALVQFLKNGKTITAAGQTLSFHTGLLENCAATSISGYILALVVPDTLVESATVQNSLLVANCQGDRVAMQDRLMADLDSFISLQPIDLGVNFNSVTKNFIKSTYAGTKAIIAFVGIYLGLIFLITSAAILALQQLSEVSDNRQRYAILKKTGTDDHMINLAILKQTAIYFLLPLILAIVHSVVGLRVANEAIASMGSVNAASNIIVTAGLILLVYGAYFLATYLGCRSMIGGRRMSL